MARTHLFVESLKQAINNKLNEKKKKIFAFLLLKIVNTVVLGVIFSANIPRNIQAVINF